MLCLDDTHIKDEKLASVVKTDRLQSEKHWPELFSEVHSTSMVHAHHNTPDARQTWV